MRWEVVKCWTGSDKPWRALVKDCLRWDTCSCKSFRTWAEAMAYVAQVIK